MLLVADEVVCGFGRTGRWFGSERFGIEPDIMTVAKGLSSGYVPIAAVLLGRASATRWPRRMRNGRTGSPTPGIRSRPPSRSRTCASSRPRACTSARAGRLAIISPPRSPASPITRWSARRAAAVCSARSSWSRTRRTRRYFPPARKVGLTCREHCIANGLVMRAVRDVMILAPPLVITEDEIDEIARRARRALDLTMRDLELA